MTQRRTIAAALVVLLAACGGDSSSTSSVPEPAAATVTQSASPPSATRRPSPTAAVTAGPTPTPAPTPAPLTGEFVGLTYFELDAWNQGPDGAVTALLVRDDGSTTELVSLDPIEAFGVVSSRAWSPDGSMLAFGAGFEYTIWVVGADGSDPRTLPVSGAFVDWSPDSRSILVEEVTDVTYPDWIPQHWIVDVVTGEVREVELPYVSEWLADGSILGVEREGSPGAPGPIVVVSANDERTTLPLTGISPRLSPSGDRIAFVSLSPTGQPGSWGDAQLAVAKRDGSDVRLIGPGFGPVWSPTGSRIAYLEKLEDGSGRSRLAIASASGDQSAIVDINTADGFSPMTWSPDGSFLVVAAAEGQGTQLWRVAADTGEAVQLPAGVYPVWRSGTTH